MTRKTVIAVGTLALLMLSAGCISGLGGGNGGGDGQAPSAGVIITEDIVPGHQGFPENTTSALVEPCVPLGTYARGMQPAWHVSVIDASTGDKLTNETVDSVTVEVADQTVETSFNTDDGNWHGCFVLSDDAPTGEMDYTVVVEVGDETYRSTGSFNVVERGDL